MWLGDHSCRSYTNCCGRLHEAFGWIHDHLQLTSSKEVFLKLPCLALIISLYYISGRKSHLSLRSQVRQKRSGYILPSVIGCSENGAEVFSHYSTFRSRMFRKRGRSIRQSAKNPEESKPRIGITTLGLCRWVFAPSPFDCFRRSLWFLKRQRIDIDDGDGVT